MMVEGAAIARLVAIFATQGRIILNDLNDLNKIKSRLGSLSKTKLAVLSPAASKLLTTDMPRLISEIEAAREVIKFLRFDEQRISWFVHERLHFYDKITKS
jgi:hypothetical protein